MKAGTRIEDAKAIIGRIAEIVTQASAVTVASRSCYNDSSVANHRQFDDDGISIRFINSSEAPDSLRTPAEVAAAVGRVRFDGGTPIGSQLEAKVRMFADVL